MAPNPPQSPKLPTHDLGKHPHRKGTKKGKRTLRRERERELSLCYIFLLCRLEDYPSPEKQEASKLMNTTRKP
jgi:hypothetical protein